MTFYTDNNEIYNRLVESISDELIELLEGGYMDAENKKLQKYLRAKKYFPCNFT